MNNTEPLPHSLPHSLPRSLTERFSAIITAICVAVAARVCEPKAPPVQAGPFAAIPGAMILLIHARLRRIEARFRALAEQILAGTYRAPAPARPLGALGPARAIAPGGVRLPRRFAWLCGMVPHEVAAHAGWLRHLLEDPAMAAAIAAAPVEMGRLLRPVGHMLGIEPAAFPPPPPRRGPRRRQDDACGDAAQAPPSVPGGTPVRKRFSPPPEWCDPNNPTRRWNAGRLRGWRKFSRG